MLIGFCVVMAVLTAIGCYCTERIDRPRRRRDRLAAEAAATPAE